LNVETATVEQSESTLSLRVTREQATRDLQAAAKIGQAIRGQRIRDMRDLDEARREKQEWVQHTMDLLERVVTAPVWVEQFNDFIPTILPEYAEFGMFTEIFEEEMRHRLGRLQGFMKAVNKLPEPAPQPRSAAAQAVRAGLPASPAGQSPPPAQAAQASGASMGAVIAQVLNRALGPSRPASNEATAPATESPTTRSATPGTQDQSPTSPEPIMNQQQLQQPQMAAASALQGPASSHAATQQGAVVIRTPEDSGAAEAIGQFLQKLELTSRVIDRRSPGGPPMLQELADQPGPRFILMLIDPSNGSPGGAGSTPDDLFDLGCCVGRMGPDRVVALHRGGESGMDRYGIPHVPLDDGEGWHLQLARLLRKAGVNIDLNKLA
jgi:hypothetical protein